MRRFHRVWFKTTDKTERERERNRNFRERLTERERVTERETGRQKRHAESVRDRKCERV